MLGIIKFDKRNQYWSKSIKCNEEYVSCMISYIYDKLKARGYIYLNEIYDILGGALDPRDHNHCFHSGDELRFSYQTMGDNEIEVLIYY